MFSTLRTRFGIPGVISVMALVFAMFGGAYAASNSSGDGKAAASAKKAKKGPRGPRGPAGLAGPAGPAGPQGPTGAKGDKGDAGANGSNGSAGSNGQSVTTATEPPFGNCGEQEGVKLTSASGVSYLCNGANGAPGPQGIEGKPWTAGGTLPANATQTGTFSINGNTGFEGPMLTGISFPIPLASGLDAAHTVLVTIDGNPDPTHCTGSPTEPKATSGYLCVYAVAAFGFPANPDILQLDGETPGAGKGGAFLGYAPPTTDEAFSFGSWAVTG